MSSQQPPTPSTSSAPENPRQPQQETNVGPEAASAGVQSSIDVLNQTLGQSRARETQNPEIGRSFPGFFKRGSKRPFSKGHASPASKLKKIWKPFEFAVFLIDKNTEMTPSSDDQVKLFQAGLGKRHLVLEDDLSHSEITSLFEEAYPKLGCVSGGWLLYKASGGQGRRRIHLVSPGSEGYTGHIIRTATGSGKTQIYMVPLQDNFDLAPLPPDAKEFSLMPKAACKKCLAEMPLQILALHVKTCNTAENTTSSDSELEPDTVWLDSPGQTSVPSAAVGEQLAESLCPVCMNSFPLSELELHASSCGDWHSQFGQTSVATMGTQKEHFSGEDDVLQFLSRRVDTSKEFNICVSRTNLTERGLLLWKRQKNSSPVHTLKVKFLGEAGIDTGALRKEFLTEMIGGIEARLFEGDIGGRMPKYSLNDLDNGLFRVAGEVMAVSLAQGGPAPRFLQPWCYNFLVDGRFENICTDGIHDAEYSPLIKAIDGAPDLSALSDEIINCGYTGPINEPNKGQIKRAVAMHAAARRSLMLQQLSDGLQLYGLLPIMTQNSGVCRSLFVPNGGDDAVDSDYLVSHLDPQMSEIGTLKHSREVQIVNHFQDFLLELEDEGSEDAEGPSVSKVMSWLSGQAHKPLLQSERKEFKITIVFDHTCLEREPNHRVCYPIVSACTQTITFPTAHFVNYSEFKTNFTIALQRGSFFYRI